MIISARKIKYCAKMLFAPGRVCCVITGASRGFGRSVAVALSRQCADHKTEGHFILVSRSEDGLQETRNKIIEICSAAEGKLTLQIILHKTISLLPS